ncbi:MAG: acetyl-CoA carboxylase biotin carboxyl carrier protein subunit [Candidatus Krumholzibacteriia bacterium]
MLLHLRDDDGDHAVAVVRQGGRWLVTIDGREHELQAGPDGAGGWLVVWQGGRRRLRTAARGQDRFVFADGRTHHLQLVDPDQEGAAQADPAGPVLRAGMPGKVVRVLAAVGDRVEAGRPLVILESMKMETELAAAVAGTVARVHVADGQVVAQGDPLVDVAPDTDADDGAAAPKDGA